MRYGMKTYECAYCAERFTEPSEKSWWAKYGDWWKKESEDRCPFCGCDSFYEVKDDEDENEEEE